MTDRALLAGMTFLKMAGLDREHRRYVYEWMKAERIKFARDVI